MGKRLKQTDNNALSPFGYEFGEKIGAGQDNFVRVFASPKAAGLVVKISQQKGDALDTVERATQSTIYKKKKYEILKLFLGDFVPDSSFVIGHKTEGRRDPFTVPKSFTVQQQVPQYRIDELTLEQQRDPRLSRQLFVLMRKMQNMYLALEEVNIIVGEEVLDGKLDIGKVSKYVRNEYEPKRFNASEVITNLRSSPNLLVDPKEMRLYCIDFVDGSWDDEKESAKGLLEFIVETNPSIQEIIGMRPNLDPQMQHLQESLIPGLD